MAVDYLSGEIQINTTPHAFSPAFDVSRFSFFSDEGDYYIQLKDESGWGDWIPGLKDIETGDDFPCRNIRVKSKVGTITLRYYIKGTR